MYFYSDPDEISKDATDLLLRTFSGERICVPKKLSHYKSSSYYRLEKSLKGHEEIELVKEAYDYIVSNFGGIHLNFPKHEDNAKILAENRRKTIISSPHVSANTLARSLKVSVRRVEQIRQQARERNGKSKSRNS